MKVTGGKSVYGASVGILMMDAQFPRVLGDMGNARTWPFPVLYKVVRGAAPERVVRDGAPGLLENFISAARELVHDGADGIASNCGFLSLFQNEIADAVQVPVATSSLLQVATVNRILPKGRRAGILTISKSSLSPEHLAKAGVPDGTPIETTEGAREFTRVILENDTVLDIEAARLDNVEAGKRLVELNPEVGAIVLECTNMTPYSADIRDATGLPVFSIVNFISWFQSGLAPTRY